MTILRLSQTISDGATRLSAPRLLVAAVGTASLVATVLVPTLVWAKPRPAHIRVETARLRSGPDESRHLVGLLDAGRTARVIERRDGWARVRLQTGTEGWVRSDLVKVSHSRKAEAAAKAAESKQRAKVQRAASARAAKAKHQIAVTKAAKAGRARKIAVAQATKAAHTKKVAAAAKSAHLKKVAAAARLAQAKRLAAARVRAQQIAANRAGAQRLAADHARALEARRIAQAKEAALRAERIARAEALLRPATEPTDASVPAQAVASQAPERSVRGVGPGVAVPLNAPAGTGEAVKVVEPVVPVEGSPTETSAAPEPREGGEKKPVPVKVAKASPQLTRGDHMVRTALNYRGTPYRFGARGERAFDCSGFTSYIWRKAGSPLPRTAAQQYRKGVPIPRDKMQSGDLVFFKNTYKRGVSHVGVYTGNGEFVHASSGGRQVRVDSLSKPYYLNHWAGARRMFNTMQKAR